MRFHPRRISFCVFSASRALSRPPSTNSTPQHLKPATKR